MKARTVFVLAGLSFFLLVCLLTPPFLLADDPPAAAVQAMPGPLSERSSSRSGRTIRVDVDLVLVNVTVTDPFNRLVTGLEKENFKVLEDQGEQDILHFSSEDVPISLGVIFDVSGSMSNKLDKSRMAALQFLKTANPADEFFLVTFSDRAVQQTSFTSSVEEVQSRLMFTRAKGRTALLDGIYLGLNQMRSAHNARRALLIISDGGDNHSRYNENDIKRFVKESDVQLYSIGIFNPIGTRPTSEEVTGPMLLSSLTETTGGRSFAVQNIDDLPDVATKISIELRNQYVIGYRPHNRARDGRWRKIRVKLLPPPGLPPLNVYAKTGYYAPTE
ncbi:MAG TPA: VWA domain-containing protein [Candidatus Acidoferrales bacterium]